MLGVREGMEKVAVKADVRELVNEMLTANLPPRKEPSGSDELETLFPEDGKMEAIITALEEKLEVQLESDTLFGLFAEGTVDDLVQALASEVMEKTAYSQSHAYYRRNRQQIRMRQRAYRMRNMHQIRRRARIYRMRVRRRSHRPRRRVGTAAGGYSFVAR